MPIPIIDKLVSAFGGPIIDRNLVENNLVEITGNTAITSTNLETYNRKILWSEHISGTFDVTLEESLNFDFFDISVTGAGALRFVASGADRINGEGDYRFTEFEGGRLQNVTDNVFVLVHEDAISPSSAVLTEAVSYTTTPVQNVATELTGKVHVLAEGITGFDTSVGATFEDDGLFVVVKTGMGVCEFDVSATGQTFGGLGSGNAYDMAGNSATWFYVTGTTLYPFPGGGSGNVIGDHPAVLIRDTPSLTELQAIADASLNNNSGLWVVASDQIAATESGVDPTVFIRALEAGLLDANGDEIPTAATQKNTIVLNGGTIVRIFSNTDLRVVSAPATVAQEMRYPDIPFTDSVVMGESDPSTYNSFLSRTATNAGGSNQYIQLPDLHPNNRPTWVNPGDVFVMRHTGTTTGNQRPHFRPDNTGDSIAANGLRYWADPGVTIAVQAPARGVRTWQLFPVAQRSDGVSYYNPEAMGFFFMDELETVSTENPVSLYNRHTIQDGLVRDHIRTASHVSAPISRAFQRKNYQDDIAWIEWWSVFAAVPPLGTDAAAILDNIPTSLAWIESNINNGFDFEFDAPDALITIPAITNDGGDSFRIEVSTALPTWLEVNDTITIAGADNAGNNGTFAIDSIAGDRLLFNITNASGVNESGTGAYIEKTIYCDAVLVSHDLRQTNFNLYEESGRTTPAPINPDWFDPDNEDSDSVLAIGYNTDVLTVPPALRMEDDNGDFFASLAPPRGQFVDFDNTGGEYQNIRYLPLNYEKIYIRTLGTCDFFFDLHPDDLPVGQSRRYEIFSDPANDNDDVDVGVGRQGSAVTSDEGLLSVSILNGTSQALEIYNTGATSGWRLAKPFEKYIPSASLVSVVTPAEGPIAMSIGEIVSAENQDPNFSFFTILSNKITCRGRFRYEFTMRIKLRFDGAEDTGLSFVNVSLVPTRERDSVTTDITRETGNSTAKIDFVRNGNSSDDNTKPIYTLTGNLSYFAEPDDEIGWELRFGAFPSGYSLSDLRQVERQYTINVKGGID